MRQRRDAADAERDPEEGEHGLGEVCERLGRIGRGIVKRRDKDVLRPEPFGDLDDDGELVEEEVVCRVDDEGDVVEVALRDEVCVAFDRCGAGAGVGKGSGEGGTEGGDPAVEREELVDGGGDVLGVGGGGFFVDDAGGCVCVSMRMGGGRGGR